MVLHFLGFVSAIGVTLGLLVSGAYFSEVLFVQGLSQAKPKVFACLWALLLSWLSGRLAVLTKAFCQEELSLWVGKERILRQNGRPLDWQNPKLRQDHINAPHAMMEYLNKCWLLVRSPSLLLFFFFFSKYSC
jgi:hypothetical protein